MLTDMDKHFIINLLRKGQCKTYKILGENTLVKEAYMLNDAGDDLVDITEQEKLKQQIAAQRKLLSHLEDIK